MVGESNVGVLNNNLAQVMITMMNHTLCERDNTTNLDKGIEKIVDANGHINGKDVTRYLEGYKTEM